jgi:hypothetical protein
MCGTTCTVLPRYSPLRFFGDYIIIDAAGGNIIGPTGRYIEKALVMPEVKIGLGTIVCYIALAMLVRV